MWLLSGDSGWRGGFEPRFCRHALRGTCGGRGRGRGTGERSGRSRDRVQSQAVPGEGGRRTHRPERPGSAFVSISEGGELKMRPGLGAEVRSWPGPGSFSPPAPGAPARVLPESCSVTKRADPSVARKPSVVTTLEPHFQAGPGEVGGTDQLPCPRRAGTRPRPAELSKMSAAQRLQLL